MLRSTTPKTHYEYTVRAFTWQALFNRLPWCARTNKKNKKIRYNKIIIIHCVSVKRANAFNQLGQYTSSPGRRGYCYTELAVFFPSGGRNHRQYSLRLPTEGWPGWVVLGVWLRSETLSVQRQSPIPLLTGLNVEQLRWSNPTRYRYTNPHAILIPKTHTTTSKMCLY